MVVAKGDQRGRALHSFTLFDKPVCYVCLLDPCSEVGHRGELSLSHAGDFPFSQKQESGRACLLP